MLSDSNLSLEDISIVQVTEDVTVDSSTDLNLTVEEVEGAVTISGNMIDVTSVNKNIGGVVITGNTITTLSCSINTPAPTGSGILLVPLMANVQPCKRVSRITE